MVTDLEKSEIIIALNTIGFSAHAFYEVEDSPAVITAKDILEADYDYEEDELYLDEDEKSDIESKIDLIGKLQLIDFTMGLEDDMFTARVVLYLIDYDFFVLSFTEINSYENCLDEHSTLSFRETQPKEITTTIYE